MSPIVMLEVAVLGLLGLAALALGIGMAFRPAIRRYDMLRPVSVAMVFACIWITLTGLINMLTGIFNTQAWSERSSAMVAGGLAELLVPSVLAAAVLTVSWGLAAVGLRRLE